MVDLLASLTDGKLGSLEVEIYRHASRVDVLDTSELSAAVPAADEREICRAVARLAEFQLLRPAPGYPRGYAAVPPDAARNRYMSGMIHQAMEMQSRIDRTSDAFSVLDEQTRPDPGAGADALESFESWISVQEPAAEYAALARQEIRISQPGRSPRASDSWAVMECLMNSMRPGVGLKVILHGAAQFNPDLVEFANSARREYGAEFRTLVEPMPWLVLFDAETLLVLSATEDHQVTMVRNASVSRFAAASFDVYWSIADRVSSRLGPAEASAISRGIKSRIVALLIQGECDKVIAKRVGLSVRTCQRHIREIMDSLGARSRLHAGYILREYMTPDITSLRSHIARPLEGTWRTPEALHL
ncbi:hypothetical protein [Streptomyces sp. CAU 1734]|uniref:hypothetical protein n=1 Tax=Streptomyces sp. CAU 1734 TaxID=3140360 RepID=UPI0032601088